MLRTGSGEDDAVYGGIELCGRFVYAATIGAALRDELGDTRLTTKSLMQ